MRNFPLLLMTVLGSGCATMTSDVHHFSTRRIGDSLTLLTSSSQIIVTNPDGSVCVGPPPDATADMGMAASVALVGGSGSDGVGSEEEELPLGGRNPNVLVTRDLLFQSCLAESRLGLVGDERKAHYQALLDLLAKINANSLEGKNVENVEESGDQNVALPSDR